MGSSQNADRQMWVTDIPVNHVRMKENSEFTMENPQETFLTEIKNILMT